MNKPFLLAPETVHLWYLFLPDFSGQVEELSTFLSPDELSRAERFRFAVHRERFIITRAYLRKTLSLYVPMTAQAIVFRYGPHGKPYLNETASGLQFNVSHSHTAALFAVTVGREIGVDIERVVPPFKASIAKRFFSEKENDDLMKLPEKKRITAFYDIWARKEALIKALGVGLYGSIEKISTDFKKNIEWISFEHENKSLCFEVRAVNLFKEYKAAIATLPPLTHLAHWQWTPPNITSPLVGEVYR